MHGFSKQNLLSAQVSYQQQGQSYKVHLNTTVSRVLHTYLQKTNKATKSIFNFHFSQELSKWQNHKYDYYQALPLHSFISISMVSQFIQFKNDSYLPPPNLSMFERPLTGNEVSKLQQTDMQRGDWNAERRITETLLTPIWLYFLEYLTWTAVLPSNFTIRLLNIVAYARRDNVNSNILSKSESTNTVTPIGCNENKLNS